MVASMVAMSSSSMKFKNIFLMICEGEQGPKGLNLRPKIKNY